MDSSQNEKEPTISRTSVAIPTEAFVYQNSNILALQKSASEGDVPAQELLGLMQARHDLEEKFGDLEKNSDALERKIENYRSELQKVNNFMIGVVVAVSIAFIVTTLTLYWDQILATKSDKELYLKYNDVYKNYSDATNSQQMKISDLEQQIELLKARNSYLK